MSDYFRRFLVWLGAVKPTVYTWPQIIANVRNEVWTIEQAAALTGKIPEAIVKNVLAEGALPRLAASAARARGAVTAIEAARSGWMLASWTNIGLLAAVVIAAPIAIAVANTASSHREADSARHVYREDWTMSDHVPASIGHVEDTTLFGANDLGLTATSDTDVADTAFFSGGTGLTSSSKSSVSPTDLFPKYPVHPWSEMTGMEIRKSIERGAAGTHLYAVTNPIYSGGHYVFVDQYGETIRMSIHDRGVRPFKDDTAGFQLRRTETRESGYYGATEFYRNERGDDLHKSYVR